MAKTKRSQKHILSSVIFVIGLACVAFAAFGIYDYIHTTRVGSDFPSRTEVTSHGEISEKPIMVNDADNYAVPDDEPRAIEIPSLKVSGYIQRVGVGTDGAMATPNNINFAGWYVRNPSPGDKGISVINGHAGGKYNDGIFKHINQLKNGDRIAIEMGDLSRRNFSVVSIGVYSVTDASNALFKDDASIDRELHLITCDGDFNDASQTYNKRTVVVAKYVQ